MQVIGRGAVWPEIISLERWRMALKEDVLADFHQERALRSVEGEASDQDRFVHDLEALEREGTAAVPAGQMRTVIRVLRQVQACQDERRHPPGRLRFQLAALRDQTGLPLDTTLL